MATTPIIVSPQGGMNQDDSLVTPAKDAAGRSLFEVGDYRYALNARIGSSRGDHFGDLENIRSTSEVTPFVVKKQIFQNNTFQGSLSPWKQIHRSGQPWTWQASPIAATSRPILGLNDIIYQDGFSFGDTSITISYKYRMSPTQISPVSSFLLRVVFLQGTTILSESTLDTRASFVFINGSKSFTLPSGCDGIGVFCQGSGSISAKTELSELSGEAWVFENRPSGTEKVVGKYEDHEFLRLYYCVRNSNNNHAIRYWDKRSNKIFEILRWSGLDFNNFVKMSKIDNWLALADRKNINRLIDVDTIADTAILLGTGFRDFHISFHKWAPIGAPLVGLSYDGVTNNTSKFRDKMIQFSWRYIYKGNLRSRWSPVSAAVSIPYNGSTAFTEISVSIPGRLLNVPGANDRTNYFNNIDEKGVAAIESIQIAYRNGINDIWKMWKQIPVTSTTQGFRGDADNTPIPESDFNQPFDTVPFISGGVEAIDNRFVFYDNLDEQPSAGAPIVESVGVVDNASGFANLNWNVRVESLFSSLSLSERQEIVSRNSACQRTFKSRGLYKVGIVYEHNTGWRSLVYTAENWIYDIPARVISNGSVEPQIALTFKFSPNFRPPEWAVAYYIVRTNCLNIASFMYGVCNKITPIIDDVSAYVNGLTGVSQDLRNAISQYFLNTPLTDQNVIGDLDTKIAGGLGSGRQDSIYWATVQYLRKTKEIGIVGDSSRLFINVKNWYSASQPTTSGTKDNPMNNLYYNWRRGDRCRFVAASVTNPSDNQKSIWDAEIIDFTGDGIIVQRPENVLWVPTDFGGVSDDYLIEVYTPQDPTANDLLFWETGEWYPIVYPGTSQRDWSKKDWTFTNTESVIANSFGDFLAFEKHPLFLGDCSALYKQMYRDGTPLAFQRIIPSMSEIQDKTYGFWERAIGRPYLAYNQLPVQKFKQTQARFGGKIVEESFINNLNNMRDEDQYIYPSEYGRIMDMVNTSNAQVESTGSILLAIGQRETWSIYVNRTTLEDLSGRTQVSISDKVLGAFNVLLGSRGTLNPESVSKYRGRVYFWDVLNGVWCRYGRDGITDISSYKMRNWFKELADIIDDAYQTTTPPRVISGFDSFNDELITLIDHSSLPAEFRGYSSYKGSLFSEEDTRWKACHDFTPEFMGRINNQLVMFKAGGVFLYENDPSSFSTFFGQKFDVMYEPVFTGMVQTINYNAIAILSSHKWSAERILSEYRGSKQKQQTRIPLTSFKEKEDTFWASLNRDVTSMGGLLNGRPMKSRAIQALLKLDPSVNILSLLHYVAIEQHDSPKNP
jgi:hypothetical protein